MSDLGYAKRHVYRGEINSGEKLVETAGYISPKQRIENMFLAGERLREYRENMYDADPSVDEDDLVPDVTMTPNFDMADASRIKNEALERLKNASKVKGTDNADKAFDPVVSGDTAKIEPVEAPQGA